MSLTRGSQLGAYEIVAPIGAGGMGEVYRARDKRLGRDVAIKVLPQTFVADRERLARFEREARLLASINHQNIAQIYGLDGEPPFIVMELVDGETLADKLTGGRALPIAECLAIADQLVDALDAAHERGIVHRDLKPANIKITPDGVVKVLDFGLAKAEAPTSAGDLSQSPTITSDHTKAGVILGTAAFMSPEQARGKPVDKRTDIWAFGCVLFEVLTGRAAFGGETVSDVIGAILHKEPEWDRLPPTLSPRVRELLKRCLQKEAKQRLRDIGDARSELDAPLEIPMQVRPADVSMTQRSLPWVIAAAATIAALTLGLRSRASSTSPTSGAPQLSSAIRITNTPDAEFGPAISPDGKWVAYYSTVNGRTDLIVKFLESQSTLNLTASLPLILPTRAGQGGVAISPDGATIALIARTDMTTPTYDSWTIAAPLGGVPRKLFGAIGSVQWSPDGKQLAYTIAGGTGGDGLGTSSFDGTNQRVVVSREGGRHIHWPAWSRDGRYIYFIYTYESWHTEPAEVYRVVASGGAPEPVVRSVRRAIHPAPLPGGALVFSANPDSLDLSLWWQRSPGAEPVRLTNGLGEHIETRVSADGKRLVATLLDMRQSLVSIPVNGGETKSLSDGRSGDVYPSVDFRTGRIVFSSSRSGHRNLWIMDADGTNPMPLTTESSIDENPSVSPDGQQIAFVSDRGGERAIWVMSVLGGAPRLVVKEIVLDTLTWSRDGRRLYFAKPGADLPSLASVDVADGRVQPVVSAAAVAPAWSPTADVLALMKVTNIPAPPPGSGTVSRIYPEFMDGTGNVLRLDERQTMTNPLTAWDKEGRRLAVLTIPANGPAQIWIMEPSGTAPPQKVFDFPPSVQPRGITWTKDSDHLVVGVQDYHGDIVMYDLR